MTQFITWLEKINRNIGRVVRWLALFMVLVQFFIVILRYALGYSGIAANESVLYMHATMFMLASGYTLLVDGHVRVDIFYAKSSRYRKAIIDILGHLFLLIPSMLALMYWSWPSVYSAWVIKEGAISVGGIPGIWLLKLLIPSFCLLLLIQSIACLLKNIVLLTDNDKQDQESKV